MKLYVDTGTMKLEIEHAKQKKESIDTQISNISSYFENFSSIWQGSDYDIFKSNMDNYIEQLKGYSEQIDVFTKYLKNYVESLEGIDEVYANKNIKLV